MASAKNQNFLHPMLLTLLQDGLLLNTQATTIQNLQKSSNKSVEYLLMALGLASERTLQNYLQQQFGVDALINPFDPPQQEAIAKVSKSSAGKSRIIPQKVDAGTLHLLAVPPINPNTTERIGKKTGLMVIPMVITELRYKYLMESCYGVPMEAEEHDVALKVLEGADPDHHLFYEPEIAIYDPFSGPIPSLPNDDPLEIAKLPINDSELYLLDEFKQDVTLLLEDAIPGFTDEQRHSLLRSDESGIFSHALSRYEPLDPNEISSLLSTVQSRDDLPPIFYSFASNAMRTTTLLTCADDFAMGWTGAGLGLLPQRLEGIIVPEDRGTFIAQIIEEKFFSGTVEPTTVNKRLLAIMGGEPDDLVLAGVVAIKDRPVIVAVFVVDDDSELETERAVLEDLCGQMSSCLIRLIRKKRSKK